MGYEEIIEAIRHPGGGLSRDTAGRATQATLQTLAGRLPPGETRHIPQGAAGRAQAVHLHPDRRSATCRSCPPASSGAGPGSRSPGPGHAEARQACEAVPETLAERTAAGQAEDLMAQLGPLLHPPLRQGMTPATPGRGMSPEDFPRQVTAREDARGRRRGPVQPGTRARPGRLRHTVPGGQPQGVVRHRRRAARGPPAAHAGRHRLIRSPRPLVGTTGRKDGNTRSASQTRPRPTPHSAQN